MSDILRGAALPSAQGPPEYDVIAPKIGESYDLTLLDEYIYCLDCHWVIDPLTKVGRSRRCFKDEGDCPHCGIDRNLWLAWIGVIDHARRQRKILRLGLESVKTYAASLPKGHKPRGKRYDVTRAKSAATALVVLELSQREPLVPLPKPHLLAPTICRVMGCESIPDYVFSAQDLRDRGEA